MFQLVLISLLDIFRAPFPKFQALRNFSCTIGALCDVGPAELNAVTNRLRSTSTLRPGDTQVLHDLHVELRGNFESTLSIPTLMPLARPAAS
eukprot:CAMPEP_0115361932 /NCGR_PEP_ID=MMETSP0270-20121206/102451_1 /TAXON_ID=71861 /ORGANISM="Scrippsiella trochoidea, Strain CCMP3099" /LENGTH=91 /DNA_ID=CAMNT_0002784501 /DNA_START=162 /DNA_END=435 /DNA_ORIENTATION=-